MASPIPLSLTSGELKDIKISAGAFGLYLWPIFSTIELLTGQSVLVPLASLAAMRYVSGDWPWNATFPQFFKGYVAGGAVFALGVNSQLEDLKAALKGESSSVEGRAIYAAELKSKQSITDWCATNSKSSILGPIVCGQAEKWNPTAPK